MAILLVVTGCADFRMPRIDPSGEHLFICDSPPPAAATCPPGTAPTPMPVTSAAVVPASSLPAAARPPAIELPQVSPYSDVAVTVSPFRAVEPVGSQVPIVAGVRSGDGYYRTNRRLEWWIMPGSVGQFTGIGENDFSDYLVGDFTHPRIISTTSAVGSTTRVAEWAGGPANRAFVARGQGWVTVSSPVEGVSHVTVVAPDVVLPGAGTKSATIYWIDAQFGLPAPAIAPAGGKQLLSTTVWRQSNHSPRAGWIVRYEAVCGPSAVFGPAGSPSIEVLTNEAGQAGVEILQKDPSPGTNQVRFQVFLPADSCGERLKVREGSVLVSWTAPSLGIRQMGPPTVVVGETITYRIEVSNPGDLPAREVLAAEDIPNELTFLQGNPAPVVEGRHLQWRLGDLAPRQQQTIEATFRTTRPGAVAHCVEVTAGGGLRSSHCANTNVVAALPGPVTTPAPATIPGSPIEPPPGRRPSRTSPAPAGPTATAVLDLQVTPVAQAVVGSDLTFNIDLTNRGTAPATGILIRDTFGEGLEHKEKSPIQKPQGDLGPRQSARFGITFRITKAGQLCHRVEATAADGTRVTKEICVTAVLPAGSTGPVVTPSPDATSVSPPTRPTAPPLQIRVSGPATSMVDKSVVFTATITNPGTQPVANVVVTQQADAALAVVQVTDGAKKKGNDVVWTLPSVPPGSFRVQVQCDCKQTAGNACCRFSVAAADGRAVEGQACLEITAAVSPSGKSPSTPPAAIPGRLSVLVDNRNIVTAGKDQQFEIQVTNQGDYAENDVIVTANFPPGLAVDIGTVGPSADVKVDKQPGRARFSPVAELPPKAIIIYRVVLTTSTPGPISLEVEATSRRQTQPAVGRKSIDVLPKE